MDCQLGGPLKALIPLIYQELTWIRRALPRAVPQCGHRCGGGRIARASRRPRTWVASTAGSNSKTARASRLRLRLHAKDQTLPFRLPASWLVISSYHAVPFNQ